MNQVFLKSLTVPASVRVIGNDSFKDCVSLSRIFFEEGSVLERIGDRAFAISEDMSIKVKGSLLPLKEVWFPRSLRELGEECFVYRRGLSRIMFEKGSNLRSIGRDAFAETCIKRLTIPSSVEVLDEGCFYKAGLEVLKFEEGSKLKSIGLNAFAETYIKRLTIPSSVEVLDDCCFSKVELEVLQFEEGSMLRRIGKFAFYDNDLSEITLPDSVQVLGNMSFYQAFRDFFVVNISVGSQLSDVGARVFPPYAEIIDASGRVLSRPDFNPHPQIIMGSNLYWRANRWIRNRGAAEILEIPNTIQKIDDRCCQEMHFDRVVFAPGSQVKVLGKKLFFYGGINSPLRIPDSVEEIRKACFNSMSEDCEDFAIIFGPKSNLQTVGKEAFDFCISGGIIVHSQRVYDLIYQNLVASYGLEQSPQGLVLSSKAPRLILKSEEEFSRLILESEEESSSEE